MASALGQTWALERNFLSVFFLTMDLHVFHELGCLAAQSRFQCSEPCLPHSIIPFFRKCFATASFFIFVKCALIVTFTRKKHMFSFILSFSLSRLLPFFLTSSLTRLMPTSALCTTEQEHHSHGTSHLISTLVSQLPPFRGPTPRYGWGSPRTLLMVKLPGVFSSSQAPLPEPQALPSLLCGSCSRKPSAHEIKFSSLQADDTSGKPSPSEVSGNLVEPPVHRQCPQLPGMSSSKSSPEAQRTVHLPGFSPRTSRQSGQLASARSEQQIGNSSTPVERDDFEVLELLGTGGYSEVKGLRPCVHEWSRFIARLARVRAQRTSRVDFAGVHGRRGA